MSKHGKKRRAQNEKPAAKVPRKVEVVAPPPQVNDESDSDDDFSAIKAMAAQNKTFKKHESKQNKVNKVFLEKAEAPEIEEDEDTGFEVVDEAKDTSKFNVESLVKASMAKKAHHDKHGHEDEEVSRVVAAPEPVEEKVVEEKKVEKKVVEEESENEEEKQEKLSRASIMKNQKSFMISKSKKSEEKGSRGSKENKGRDWTVSIAIPGSIIANAQSKELKTYLVGQVARACTVFNVDEIIVFNENPQTIPQRSDEGDRFVGARRDADPNLFLSRVLQYLECPQYLRKALFPQHPDLQFAGLLNPLDAPHHMRRDQELEYREGVVIDKHCKAGGCFINAGIMNPVWAKAPLKPKVRVTCKMAPSAYSMRRPLATLVPPTEPREQAGLYWGYSVRSAEGISKVFEDCPYKGGYDLTIGTSERGQIASEAKPRLFRHMLVVFGGLEGLEAAVDGDQNAQVDNPKEFFDMYLNTCPNQGSRTIRTEEAILVSMAAISHLIPTHKPPDW